ncbi:MAG: acyl-phosphate glycerol 3-phosphate acyltransferase [Salinivirgaceae bacterium]|nr:MAG: acyl-phosphate glycerol 3-phosphate acyltransferase [Salinivirgaceae bacterium]
MILIIGLLLLAYLLGSVPSAVWIGKTFFDKDVREHGSGNAGATNTFRVLGWKPGSIVFAIDTLKGFLAVYLLNFSDASKYEYGTFFFIGAGLLAVFGHIYPLFAQFKGGKGVATMLGVILGLHPVPGALALSVFVIVFFTTQYVSLGSLLAGLSFPILVFVLYPGTDNYMKGFAILLASILFFSHRANIKRLLTGTENRAKIYGKRRQEHS